MDKGPDKQNYVLRTLRRAVQLHSTKRAGESTGPLASDWLAPRHGLPPTAASTESKAKRPLQRQASVTANAPVSNQKTVRSAALDVLTRPDPPSHPHAPQGTQEETVPALELNCSQALETWPADTSGYEKHVADPLASLSTQTPSARDPLPSIDFSQPASQGWSSQPLFHRWPPPSQPVPSQPPPPQLVLAQQPPQLQPLQLPQQYAQVFQHVSASPPALASAQAVHLQQNAAQTGPAGTDVAAIASAFAAALASVGPQQAARAATAPRVGRGDSPADKLVATRTKAREASESVSDDEVQAPKRRRLRNKGPSMRLSSQRSPSCRPGRQGLSPSETESSPEVSDVLEEQMLSTVDAALEDLKFSLQSAGEEYASKLRWSRQNAREVLSLLEEYRHLCEENDQTLAHINSMVRSATVSARAQDVRAAKAVQAVSAVPGLPNFSQVPRRRRLIDGMAAPANGGG